MPQVPRKVVSDIRSAPIATPFQNASGATADAFGAAEARALQGVAGATEQIANDQQKRIVRQQIEDNEREAKRMDVEFSAALRGIGYGDGTAENRGFYATRGQDTLDTAAATKEQIEALRKQFLGNTSNIAVQDMFEAASRVRAEQEFETMDRFSLKERVTANNAVSEARIQEAADDAAAAWNDPEVLTRSIALVGAEVADLADRNGWAPEVQASKMQEAQTMIYRQAIVAALQMDAQEARRIYEAHKPAIDGTAQPEIEKLLEQGDLREAAQEATDEIMAQELDATASLAAARGIADPKLRDEVVTRVNNRLAEDRRTDIAEKKAVSADAFQHVWAGGRLDEWAASNPEAFSLLSSDGALMSSILSAENKVALGEIFARTTNGKTLAEIRQMETEDLAEINLDEVRASLTPTEYDTVARLSAAAKNKIEATLTDRASYNAGEAMLKDFAPVTMRWGSTKQSPDKRTQQQRLQNEMYMFVDSFLQRGELPASKDLAREAIRLLTPIEGDLLPFVPFFGDFETFVGDAANLTPEQRANARVDLDDIAVDQRTAIEQAYREQGIEVTDDLIEQLAASVALQDQARTRKLLGIVEPETQ